MGVTVLFFGQLTDITGSASIEWPAVVDTDALKQEVFQRFPSLASKTFRLAVGKQLITANTLLNEGQTIAFLPPFSGG